MKPFNLSEALAGKPVVTRDGHKVLKITNLETDIYPVVAKVELHSQPICYTSKGFYTRTEIENDLDLFMYEEDFYILITEKELQHLCLNNNYEQYLFTKKPNPSKKDINVYKLVKVKTDEK